MPTEYIRWHGEWVQVREADSREGLIDSFETGPDGPYASSEGITDYYTKTYGSNSLSRTDSEPAIEGSHVAYGSADDWNNYISMPGDGLEYYPSDGDVISGYLWQKPVDGGTATTQPQFGWYADYNGGGSGDGYAVMLGNVADDYPLQIRRWDGDGSNEIAMGSTTLPNESWYDVEVEIDGSTYTARAFEVDESTGERLDPDNPLDEITVTDSTYSGNDGFLLGNRGEGGTGAEHRIDHIRKVGDI